MNKKAFTLLEIIVAITVFTIFIGAIASSFLLLSRAQSETNLSRELYSDGRLIVGLFSQNLIGSQIDFEWYEQNSMAVQSTVFTTDILAIIDGLGAKIRFELQECEGESDCYNLVRITDAGEEVLNKHKITKAEFVLLSGKIAQSVKVDLTLSAVGGAAPETKFDLSTFFNLRNY